jgi:hypothetical protein
MLLCKKVVACVVYLPAAVITFPQQDVVLLVHRNYMNDSLRTDVFVRYQPETVACACIYLTSRKLNISLPKAPAWFSVFCVSEEDIQDVCFRILRLYRRPKVSHWLHDVLVTPIISLPTPHSSAVMSGKSVSGSGKIFEFLC